MINDKKFEPVSRINHKNKIFSVEDLANGEFYIAVKMKYRIKKRGKYVSRWTKSTYKKIIIAVPFGDSKILQYAKGVEQKFVAGGIPQIISILGLIVAILFFGFGTKIAFYLNLAKYKLKLIMNRG